MRTLSIRYVKRSGIFDSKTSNDFYNRLLDDFTTGPYNDGRGNTNPKINGGISKMKKMIALLLAVCLCMGTLAACGGQNPGSETTASTVENKPATETTAPVAETASAPKYVFLFIGDGMSYPQIQSTSDFLGALKDEDYFLAQPSLDDNQGATLDRKSTRLNSSH